MRKQGSIGWLFVAVLALTSASLVGCAASGSSSPPRMSMSEAHEPESAPRSATPAAPATPEEAAVLRKLLGE